MSKFKHTIEEKGDADALKIATFISSLAEKHNVDVDNIMMGFTNKDKKELYVWEWDAGRAMTEQFKALEIIYI